jgi:circadian clock protein KaiC
MSTNNIVENERTPSGVRGVDEILGGGYLPESATLVRGPPGSGKSFRM